MIEVINHIGAVGSLLGKLIISVNRYGVLRSPDLAENVGSIQKYMLSNKIMCESVQKWTRSLIYRLVALQFLLPCTSAIKVVFYDYKYEMRNGIEVAYTYTDTGIVVENLSSLIPKIYRLNLVLESYHHDLLHCVCSTQCAPHGADE